MRAPQPDLDDHLCQDCFDEFRNWAYWRGGNTDVLREVAVGIPPNRWLWYCLDPRPEVLVQLDAWLEQGAPSALPPLRLQRLWRS